MEALIIVIGVITSLNLIIIYRKFKSNRIFDAILDLTAFITINWIFSGSLAGQCIGAVASLGISIYLRVAPPKLSNEEYA